MENYFRGTKQSPHHLSIGVVVLNEKREVLCHRFTSLEFFKLQDKDLYVLIRETVEPGETLENAITRGLYEEAGVKARLIRYTGSIKSNFPYEGEEWRCEKTTIYFLCELESMDISKRDMNDPEAQSEVSFVPIDVLIEKMKRQSMERYQRSDLDESLILEEVKKYISVIEE